jgi:hypothetical protein
LARGYDFDGTVLAEAIQKTFQHRDTKIETNPFALTEFSQWEDKQTMWQAFLKRTRLESAPKELKKVTDVISQFLLPIAQSLSEGEPFKKKWRAPGPWK